MSNRSQYVSIDDVDSHILSGIPQGSVLSLLLFINDVAAAVSTESEVNMFADDIVLYRIIQSSTDYSHLLTLLLLVSNKNIFNTLANVSEYWSPKRRI